MANLGAQRVDSLQIAGFPAYASCAGPSPSTEGTGINADLESDLMRSTTRTAVVLALGCLAGGAADANAAWNNVFQTTACGCESTRSYYFAPAPTPCCPTTSYVQRCYYQPVTTYKTESYYEPVTTYRTSNYW